MELIVLGLVTGLSFLSYALWRRARGEELAEELKAAQQTALLQSAERPLEELRPGDVVMHLQDDYLVEGAITLDDDGRLTRLWRLADGNAVRWLGLRPGERQVLVLDEARDLGSLGLALGAPAELTHRGIPYRLVGRAIARVRLSGRPGDGRSGERAWIYDYASAGTRRLLAVAWEGSTDAFVGEPAGPDALQVLPGAAE